MENNIKSIHIELNGDSDTYSVEIVSTEGTIEMPYVELDENTHFWKNIFQIKGKVLKEDTQNV